MRSKSIQVEFLELKQQKDIIYQQYKRNQQRNQSNHQISRQTIAISSKEHHLLTNA